MTTEYTDNFRLALPDFRMGPWHDLINEDFVTIDELLFQIFQGVDATVWQNATAYSPGTSAIDSTDNTVWVCCVSHTSAATGTFAADRTAHPTYWNRVLVGISPRGIWAHDTHYLPNDLVSDPVSKVIALCITTHTSNHSGTIRDDAAYWSFIADLNAPFQTATQTPFDGSISHIPPSNVQTAIDYLAARGATLTEAPVDGQQYGRQLSAWTAIVPIAPAVALPSMDNIAAVGVSVKYAREDHVHPTDTSRASITYVDAGDAANITLANNKVAKAGDTMTGILTLSADPTNPNEAATKNYVDTHGGGGASPATATPVMDGVGAVGVGTKYAREDHVHPSDTSRAPLASPALTGSPTAPTQAANDNSTKIATTAYVDAKEGSATPIMDSVGAVGTSHLFARQDHVHPSDTTKANLASPALTGNPTAPTQSANDNSTKIATTAYTDAAVSVGQALDMKLAGNQTTTGGFNITPFNGGTVSSGTFTPNALSHNYQYYLNNGAHTFAVPANDCAMDVLIQNSVTPGAITFSTSYKVGANIGDAYTTANRFSVAATFVNASSTITVTGHNAVVGDPIYFTTAGTLPTNFAASTLYRVVSVLSANTITVSATVGGAAIVAGSAGSGAHTSFFPSQFIISVRRINGVSTYTIKALQ